MTTATVLFDQHALQELRDPARPRRRNEIRALDDSPENLFSVDSGDFFRGPTNGTVTAILNEKQFSNEGAIVDRISWL